MILKVFMLTQWKDGDSGLLLPLLLFDGTSPMVLLYVLVNITIFKLHIKIYQLLNEGDTKAKKIEHRAWILEKLLSPQLNRKCGCSFGGFLFCGVVLWSLGFLVAVVVFLKEQFAS